MNFHFLSSYKTRLGIDVGDIEILIHAAPIMGRQYVYSAQGKMTLEKQWSDVPQAYAYQVVLKDIAIHNQDFLQFTSITDVFKPKSVCFMLGHPHYGAMGEVGSLFFLEHQRFEIQNYSTNQLKKRLMIFFWLAGHRWWSRFKNEQSQSSNESNTRTQL